MGGPTSYETEHSKDPASFVAVGIVGPAEPSSGELQCEDQLEDWLEEEGW